jgi:hypothetical protein
MPALEAWLTQLCALDDGTYPRYAIVHHKEVPIEMLLSSMDRNNDAMPDVVCGTLNLPRGSNYAEGAQVLRAVLKSLRPRG